MSRSTVPSTAVGIDGCRGGWCVVRQTDENSPIELNIVREFAAVIDTLPADAVIAIDMPIGLAEQGERECDQLARQFLAPRRASSVFSAPLRCVLGAASHHDASARRFERDGKRMSIQAYNILAKVAEVDNAIRASATRDRVFEAHPEVAFAHMNGGVPLAQSKKSAEGQAVRLDLLRQGFGDDPARLLRERKRSDAGADDVLDALAVLWTARRIGNGVAQSMPSQPPRDTFGLAMAIHF